MPSAIDLTPIYKYISENPNSLRLSQAEELKRYYGMYNALLSVAKPYPIPEVVDIYIQMVENLHKKISTPTYIKGKSVDLKEISGKCLDEIKTHVSEKEGPLDNVRGHGCYPFSMFSLSSTNMTAEDFPLAFSKSSCPLTWIRNFLLRKT